MPDVKSRRVLFIFFFFAFFLILATRLLLLYYSSQLFIEDDETVNGVLPIHLQNGLLMPFYMYQCEEYAGGTLVVGLLAYPLFKLFGPSFFALKLVALLFSLGLFLVGFLITKKYFGTVAAIFFCVVFTFPPYFYLQRSLLANGNHMEMTTLCALGLLVFFASRDSSGMRFHQPYEQVGLMGVFGLISGIGVYFDYMYLVLLVTLIPIFLASSKSLRHLAGETVLFSIGFYIGMIPWKVYHYTYQDPFGSSFFTYAFRFFFSQNIQGEWPLGQFLVHLATTSFYDLFFWFSSKPLEINERFIIPGAVINALLMVPFTASYIYLLVRSRGAFRDFFYGLLPGKRVSFRWSKEHFIVPFLVYIPIQIFVYSVYTFGSNLEYPPYRYLHPLFLCYFVIVAFALSDFWLQNKKVIAVIGIFCVVCGSVLGGIGLLEDARPGESFRRPGYQYDYFIKALKRVYLIEVDVEKFRSMPYTHFPGAEQDFYSGLMAGIAFLNGKDISGHLAAAQGAGPDALLAFSAGCGSATRLISKVSIGKEKALSELLPPDNLDAFESGKKLGESLNAAERNDSNASDDSF